MKVKDLLIKELPNGKTRIGWLQEVDGKWYGDYIIFTGKLTEDTKKEVSELFEDQYQNTINILEYRAEKITKEEVGKRVTGIPVSGGEKNKNKFLELFT